jgi:hypothetical protein
MINNPQYNVVYSPHGKLLFIIKIVLKQSTLRSSNGFWLTLTLTIVIGQYYVLMILVYFNVCQIKKK